jgi:hypothetical protein
MPNQHPGERRKSIVDSIACMLVEHIHRHNHPDLSLDELFTRLGVSKSTIYNAWWSDIPELCDRVGVDLGITVRDRGGNTVTLWPGENFAGRSSPPKTAGKKPAIRKPITPVGQKA